jgi:hypothetical protein
MPKKSLRRHTRHKKSVKRHGKSNKHHKIHKTRKIHRKVRKHQKHYRMRGGYGPGSGPVGYPWKSDEATWPGAYASSGGNTNGMTFSNHYGYNSQGTGVGGLDPAISTRGDLANLHYQSGGGMGQDLINSIDLGKYNVSDFFSKLYGTVNPPTDPTVTKQFLNPEIQPSIPSTLNLNEIITESSNKTVAIQ